MQVCSAPELMGKDVKYEKAHTWNAEWDECSSQGPGVWPRVSRFVTAGSGGGGS